jgi:hypothetical protein
MNKSKAYQNIVVVFIAALFLSIYAFYNAFPLIFPDSMGYISHGFNNTIPENRPVFYSLFVRHISLNETLWLVVYVQGLLLSLIILYAVKFLFNKHITPVWFLVYMIVISTTTAVSLHSSMIMPDVFTPMMILALLLLIFADKLKKSDYALILIIFLLALSVHNMHFWIALSCLLFLTITALFKKVRTRYNKFGLGLRRMSIVWAILIVSNLLFSTIRFAIGGNFVSKKGGAVFVMARLIDYQILQDYLNKNCDTDTCKLCKYRHQIQPVSATFLWDFKNSPLYKIGGWEVAAQEEYSQLIRNILSRPEYLKRYIIRCIEDSFIQLCLFDIHVSPRIDNVGKVINKSFPMYNTLYLCAKQSQETMDTDYFKVSNFLQSLMIVFSVILLFLMLFDDKYSSRKKLIVILLMLMIYANSFISVAASGVYARYNSRVLWLITLPAFAYLWEVLKNRFSPPLLLPENAESETIVSLKTPETDSITEEKETE